MINFDFERNCAGCGACYNVCPANAISIKANKEGFVYPTIDNSLCIECNKCEDVCPHINAKRIIDAEPQAVWLYSSLDENAKKRSSSGAVCFDMEKAVVENNGFAVGCIWDDNLIAKHEIGNSIDFVYKTQGSKYVQSNTGSIYNEVCQKLKKGFKVVFTGTPCQATAMNNIVMSSNAADYRNSLIIVAVICHGVASPLVWEKYKEYISDKEGSSLVSVNFRDKSKVGYKKSYCCYKYEDGHSTYLPTYLPSSKYIEASIVYNLALRNSCNNCDCKGINPSIDLIVGDWYADYKGEGYWGTSCIVAITERGKTFAENNLIGLRPFDYDSIIKHNPLIKDSIPISPNRNKFFERILDYHYWDNVEELYPSKYKYKKLLVKMRLYDLLKRIIK